MGSYPKLTKLFVATAVALLLGTALADTHQTVTPVKSVRVCVKENGQLRVLTTNACDPSEKQMEWVIGGEVTELQLGRGLVGNRENGTIQLAVDPELIESCSSLQQ